MVFASSAATTMIGEFGAKTIIFTGVAGGLREGQQIGDIVVGEVRGQRCNMYPAWGTAHRLPTCCLLRV